jgi:hypothetical protein
MKTLLTVLTLALSISTVQACPSQIITLPSGEVVICYYCNGGKIVNCMPL